jgi:hypothetical protein
LYVEKEGFEALMKDAEIERRFDIAVLSNKGFSVTAGRQLVDELCGRLKLPLYILHDFDVSGFGRLADIAGLPAEPVVFGRDGEGQSFEALNQRLKTNGATAAEIGFLLDGQIDAKGRITTGKRVELNAKTSDEFVAFLVRKLTEAGAQRVVPDKATLEPVFVAFVHERIARPEVETLMVAWPPSQSRSLPISKRASLPPRREPDRYVGRRGARDRRRGAWREMTRSRILQRRAQGGGGKVIRRRFGGAGCLQESA